VSIQFGYVIARYAKAVADTPNDPDAYPDISPVAGQAITFTPVSSAPLVSDDAGEPITVLLEPIVGTLDAQGRLVDNQGRRGVWLVADVAYSVTVDFIPGFNLTIFPKITHTQLKGLDLSLALGKTPAPNEVFVVNEQVYLDTLKARDDAIAAADGLQKVRTGEFHFGGASGAATTSAGNSAIRMPFELTVNPVEYRISFENYHGLGDYPSTSEGIRIGEIWVGREQVIRSDNSDYQFDGFPVKISDGGALVPGQALITPWITPDGPVKNVPLLLSYQLQLSQEAYIVGTFGTRSFQSTDQNQVAAQQFDGSWRDLANEGSPLTVKIEFRYADNSVTSVLAIGDSINDSWAIGNQQGHRGQVTGYLQTWARQTGNTVAVNAFGTSTADSWKSTSTKWDRINQALEPDAVILSIGGNDLLEGLSVFETFVRIYTMISEIKRRYPDALLLALLVIPAVNPGDLEPRREELNGYFSQMSSRMLDGLIDSSFLEDRSSTPIKMMARYGAVDTVHLSPLGYRVLANRINLRVSHARNPLDASAQAVVPEA
jgi:lysophospholipase L1-like esterase